MLLMISLTGTSTQSFGMNQENNPLNMEKIRSGRELAVYIHEIQSNQCVFFIHGAGGRADQWHHQINSLKDQYNIVTFDLLGHGRSPKPEEGYAFSDIMTDVEAVFTKYKHEHNYVIAHSYGVAFALPLALKNEHNIQKLVLFGASTPRPTKQIGLWNLPVILLEWIRPIFSKGFAKNAFHRQTDPELVNQERSISDKNPMYMMKALIKGMKEIPEMNVSKISIPVLIINGASDGLTPVAGAKLLADKLPNAELEIVEKAAHLVMIELPEHVNELIIKFIQQ